MGQKRGCRHAGRCRLSRHASRHIMPGCLDVETCPPAVLCPQVRVVPAAAAAAPGAAGQPVQGCTHHGTEERREQGPTGQEPIRCNVLSPCKACVRKTAACNNGKWCSGSLLAGYQIGSAQSHLQLLLQALCTRVLLLCPLCISIALGCMACSTPLSCLGVCLQHT